MPLRPPCGWWYIEAYIYGIAMPAGMAIKTDLITTTRREEEMRHYVGGCVLKEAGGVLRE